MLRITSTLLLVAFAQVNSELQAWIAGGYPSELSKTMALATDTAQLLSSAGNRNIALILPTNKAWEQHAAAYKALQEDHTLGFNLLVDAAIELFSPIQSITDLPSSQELITIGGTPLVTDKNNAAKFYFGEYQQDGTVKKVGKPIKIKQTPVAKFDRILIFEATSFAMPPSLKAI